MRPVPPPGRNGGVFPLSVVIESLENQQGKITHVLKQMDECTVKDPSLGQFSFGGMLRGALCHAAAF